MSAAGLVYVCVTVVTVVAGQTLLKAGMARVGPVDLSRVRRSVRLAADASRIWQLWAGVALYVLSAALWILALSTVPLSVAYPFLGLTYVGVAAIAVMKLGEWLTPAQWFGLSLVVIGVLLVTLSA